MKGPHPEETTGAKIRVKERCKNVGHIKKKHENFKKKVKTEIIMNQLDEHDKRWGKAQSNTILTQEQEQFILSVSFFKKKPN